MRVAQWALPGSSDDAPADCVLFHFPGGGGVDDNIQRWLGQFAQPDGDSSAAAAFRAEREVEGLRVTLVRVEGTYRDQMPPMTGPIIERPSYGLFGAVFTPPGDPYFLKCTGPAVVIAGQQEAMVSFIDSFRVHETAP